MTVRLVSGEVLAGLAQFSSASVQCVVTSPPYYGLRDYGVPGQIGMEQTPEAYLARMVEVFREVRRVLRPGGTCFVNLGDSYATQPAGNKGSCTAKRGPGSYRRSNIAMDLTRVAKPKDLMMMPARLALALQADGWWLRSMLPWVKRSCMPESTTDRPTSAVEYVFMLTRSARYYWDAEAVRRGAVSDYPSGNGYRRGEQLSRGGRGSDQPWTDVGGSRNFRNSDLFFDSLELAVQQAPAARRRKVPGRYAEQKNHLVRQDGGNWEGRDCLGASGRTGITNDALGLICDEAGEPLALDVNPEPYPEAHFATYPTKLVEPLILAASRPGDTVLDPFVGSGTTALVADRLGRHGIGIELNAEYVAMAERRLRADAGLFADLVPEHPVECEMADLFAAAAD